MDTPPTLPTSPEAMLAVLDSLGITHHTLHHEPVATVEEARRLRGPVDGWHTKNLFVKDKRDQLWLITARADVAVDLNGLAKQVGGKRFTFGSADLLVEVLGVTPGSVTPLGLWNDRTARRVRFILDAPLLDGRTIHVHPLTNRMTTAISADGMRRFLAATGHDVTELDLG
ncbi:MAG: prolyl-tRNA synthetase associated domain-containing protein [Alphaproteobacteria bacterium]|nr:prolyl-tRNA synthetase associated domain-containing protein [Alphaproteobacteria bacterium]TAD90822.1 MAG: prolyl-tRNA synthetase associated domain-containing protein [Alphaproteobacteria bacterium]